MACRHAPMLCRSKYFLMVSDDTLAAVETPGPHRGHSRRWEYVWRSMRREGYPFSRCILLCAARFGGVFTTGGTDFRFDNRRSGTALLDDIGFDNEYHTNAGRLFFICSWITSGLSQDSVIEGLERRFPMFCRVASRRFHI
jgi:hypothetical protein